MASAQALAEGRTTMSLGQSIQTVFTKYAEFRGVASRSEFWWWILFTFLISAGFGALPIPILTVTPGGDMMWTASTLAGLWGLAVLLPTLAVTVRRLRDAGYEWGNLFWLLLPVAGMIVLVVLCAQPSRLLVPSPVAESPSTAAYG
jgi:uncharacterized membrane protein YhaH (DUF805 family)